MQHALGMIHDNGSSASRARAAPCWLTHCKRSCTATAPWVRSARHHVRCSPSLGSLVCCDRCRNSSVYVCKGSMPAVQSRCLVRSHWWAIGQNSAAVPAAASYTAECTGAIMKAAACRPAVPVLGLQEVAGQQKGALRVRTQQPYATWTCAHCQAGQQRCVGFIPSWRQLRGWNWACTVAGHMHASQN
jgi:hypothetical protein